MDEMLILTFSYREGIPQGYGVVSGEKIKIVFKLRVIYCN